MGSISSRGNLAKSVSRVDHTLVLQAAIPGKKIARLLFEGHAVALVVPKFFQPGLDRRSLRNRIEKFERDLVFRFDPPSRLGRIRVFQPAIRIGHFRAVKIIHLFTLACLGIIRFPR